MNIVLTQPSQQYTVTGKVQGVGFRPHVYRLAIAHKLHGWVQNQLGQVQILVQGDPTAIQTFEHDLLTQAPSISDPMITDKQVVKPGVFDDFQILASDDRQAPHIHIPVDYFTCQDCLQELTDPKQRRYQYPFTNCTQCGPRYTLITQLPYDRPHTTLADFPLCAECQQEYQNPLDRRFHAQPLACPVCGPQLQWHNELQTFQAQAALAAAITALNAGKIIAVKGIGGYHLMCDAGCDSAIQRLRDQKPRPDKPLAVMFPARGEDELQALDQYVKLTPIEADLLRSTQRPIIIATAQQNCLSPKIAPNLSELGIMLPYSPLHYLLLNTFNKPLVATSANISGEPVLTDNHEIEQRLKHVTDGFLHHNRPIARPADDSVFRLIDKQCRPIRLGRGYSPLEIALPFNIPIPTLAVGGQMKNTIALAWDQRIVLSPHIGDLESLRSQTIFKQTIEDLQRLYQIKIQHIICDAHPDYAASRWAKQSNLPIQPILHHHAHASAIVAEYWNPEPWLCFAWDGVGYGADGTLWGGEALIGSIGHWQRFASLRPFRLPGGNKASREPWRSAASLCWEANIDWIDCPFESTLLKHAWQQQINCPHTSAMGRLFDAAASLAGIIHQASYEGQGPILLEQVCAPLQPQQPLPYYHDEQGLLRLDWQPLLENLLNHQQTQAKRSAYFHSRLAHSILAIALQARKAHDIQQIGLTGGVFQNRKLTEYSAQLLRQANFKVAIPLQVPCNDGGLSFGQIIEAYGRQK